MACERRTFLTFFFQNPKNMTLRIFIGLVVAHVFLNIDFGYSHEESCKPILSLRKTRVWRVLARDVIYTSRAYAMMPVRLSVCLWRKCIGAL